MNGVDSKWNLQLSLLQLSNTLELVVHVMGHVLKVWFFSRLLLLLNQQ